jgi:hypothetical protein
MVYPFSNIPGFGHSPIYPAPQVSLSSIIGDDFSLPNPPPPQIADERSLAQEELRKIARWRQMQLHSNQTPQVSLSSIIGDDFSLPSSENPSSENPSPPPTAHDMSLIQNEIERISILRQNLSAQQLGAGREMAAVQKLEIQPSLEVQFLEAARLNDMARMKSILERRFPEVEDWERIADVDLSIRIKKFIDTERRYSRKRALHLTNDITIARFLLGLGSNPVKKDRLGLTPEICEQLEVRALVSPPLQTDPKQTPQVSLSSIIGDDFSLPSSENPSPPPSADEWSLIQKEIDRISMLRQNLSAQQLDAGGVIAAVPNLSAQQLDTSGVIAVPKLRLSFFQKQFLDAARLNNMEKMKSILEERFPEVEDWGRIADFDRLTRARVKKFVNTKQQDGKGPLHLTSDMDIARFLLRLGGYPLQKDKEGSTPEICKQPELLAIISPLIVEKSLETKLLNACIGNYREKIKSILKKKFLHVDWKNFSAVALADQTKNQLAEFVNVHTPQGGLLHLTESRSIILLLLEVGIDVLIEDDQGETAENRLADICPELYIAVTIKKYQTAIYTQDEAATRLIAYWKSHSLESKKIFWKCLHRTEGYFGGLWNEEWGRQILDTIEDSDIWIEGVFQFDNLKRKRKERTEGMSFQRAVKVEKVERVKDIIMKKFCGDGVSWGKWDEETKAKMKIFVNTYTPRGTTAMHHAQNKVAVLMLLELGASLAPKNNEGKTPAEFSRWIRKPFPEFFMADALTRLESGEFSVSEVNDRLISYWKGLNKFYKRVFAKCLKLNEVCLGGWRIKLPQAVRELLLGNKEIARVYKSKPVINDNESDFDASDSDDAIAIDDDDVSIDEDYDASGSDEDVAVDGDFDESDLSGEIEEFDDDLLDVPPSTPLSKRLRLESESVPPSPPLGQRKWESVPPSPITVPMV